MGLSAIEPQALLQYSIYVSCIQQSQEIQLSPTISIHYASPTKNDDMAEQFKETNSIETTREINQAARTHQFHRETSSGTLHASVVEIPDQKTENNKHTRTGNEVGEDD